MKYEIVRVANGYMVLPAPDYKRNEFLDFSKVYVFNKYSDLMDKLQEILDQQDFDK